MKDDIITNIHELIKNADHFFTHHLDELEIILENYIQKEIKKFNIDK